MDTVNYDANITDVLRNKSHGSVTDSMQSSAESVPYFVVIYLLESVLGITFNVLTILIIKYGKHVGKAIHLQLINLAVADILISIVIPLTNMFHFPIIPRIIFPNSVIFCKIFMLVSSGTLSTALFWSVVISVERFVAIYFPFKVLGRQRKHKIMLIVAVWMCSYIASIDTLIFGEISVRNGEPYCKTNLTNTAKAWRIAFKTFIPVIIIITMYVLLVGKQCCCRNCFTESSMRSTQKRFSKSSRQVSLKNMSREWRITNYVSF